MKKKGEKNRTLTPQEAKRSAYVQELSDRLTTEGYSRTELTVSIVRANVMAFVIGIPVCVIFAVLFLAHNLKQRLTFDLVDYYIILIAILVSIVVHELIHGLFWGLCCEKRFKSIEFGFIAKYLTPYCSCLEPLSKFNYFLGSFAPGFLLGILPMFISIFTASIPLLLYGAVMTLAAGGDFTIILKLLFYRASGRDIIYLDHPTQCGLIVFERL